MTRPVLSTLLAPLLALLAVFQGGAKAPQKRYCVPCGVSDYPRADYHTHQLFCRRCGSEFLWWLDDRA